MSAAETLAASTAWEAAVVLAGSPAGTNSLGGFLHFPGATFRSRGRTLRSKAEVVDSERQTPAAGLAWEAAAVLAGFPAGTNTLGGFLHSSAATFRSRGRTLRSKGEVAGSLPSAVPTPVLAEWVENPQPKEKGTGTGGCRGREKGKGVAGESSQAAGQPKRKVYTPEESTALAKCWVSVVEDMLNNPTRDGLWNRICKRYEVIKPQGAKYHSPEELRKKWGRLKTCVSRFCDIYENNTRSMTNGRTMDDVRELLIRQYGHAQCGLYSPFKYWDAFLVLKDSPKFQEGRAAGFSKRMRLGVSGNYKSSGASIDLEDDVDVEPYPVPRCRRPMDQKTAMRMSRRASSRCSEVQSTAPSSKLTNAVRIKHLFDFIMQWNQATDPKFKKYLESVIKQMKRNLGMSVDDDEPVAGDAAGDGGEDSDE
ncbi:uncharacterized protein LOC125213830 isoform X2 [Salvia hispanica]|uniref:uncharacterized protein LOC125213830 isoform X2 n=1 Tax=Salvia hispanica TaxID=49212 RepID=UPI002009C298|nr:uncharacterized protein LOC125213830 isoform X2 [Salvia hispanica]